MRSKVILVVLLLSSATVLGQNYFRQKDLAFAQVAVGDAIDTAITLTNRGTWEYLGSLEFTTGDGLIWNPKVNGESLTGGSFAVTIPSKSTITLSVTDTGPAVGGAAFLIADDLLLDNFVEGNLTYFVKSDSEITDSVGVQPSTEFYLASVPFQNSSQIALALANGDLFSDDDGDPSTPPRKAQVTLRVLPAGGGPALATETIELGPFAHSAKFLNEIFPGLAPVPGKLEISADIPVTATALTFVSGQLSSLPLLASPAQYDMTLTVDTTNYSGDLALWIDGYFAQGYLIVQQINGTNVVDPELTLIQGQLIDGILRLSFYGRGDGFNDEEVQLFMEDNEFSLDEGSTGGFLLWTTLSDFASTTGSWTITKVSD